METRSYMGNVTMCEFNVNISSDLCVEGISVVQPTELSVNSSRYLTSSAGSMETVFIYIFMQIMTSKQHRQRLCGTAGQNMFFALGTWFEVPQRFQVPLSLLAWQFFVFSHTVFYGNCENFTCILQYLTTYNLHFTCILCASYIFDQYINLTLTLCIWFFI